MHPHPVSMGMGLQAGGTASREGPLHGCVGFFVGTARERRRTWFHGLCMYVAKPSAMSLSAASVAKTYVKPTSVIRSTAARSDSGSSRGESRARLMEERMMKTMITRSNQAWVVSHADKRRRGWLGANECVEGRSERGGERDGGTEGGRKEGGEAGTGSEREREGGASEGARNGGRDGVRESVCVRVCARAERMDFLGESYLV